MDVRFYVPVTANEKLNELRNDAVAAWRTAIRLTIATPPVSEENSTQAEVAIKGAVTSHTQYTLACALCPNCGHRGVEHTEDASATSPYIEYIPDKKGRLEGWTTVTKQCSCCLGVGRMREKMV